MNVWIDIDKVDYIPLYLSLIQGLKKKNHSVMVTAEDTNIIKERLKSENIDLTYVGKTFSFFDMLDEQMIMLRAALLGSRIKSQKPKVDIAFSLGSKPMIYTAFSAHLNTVLFLDDPTEKINQIHFFLDNVFFLVSDAKSEQPLLKRGYDRKRIIKLNEQIFKDTANPSPRVISEIVEKLELFSTYRDLKA